MLNRLQGVFRSFLSHEVRYVVIGGVAAVLHGVPRATFDLDVLIDATLQNSGRLLAALEEAGFGTACLTSPEEILRHEITVFSDRVRIDVLTSAPGVSFEEAWSSRQEMTYEGVTFHVISRENLIVSKRASARPRDLEDVSLLERGS